MARAENYLEIILLHTKNSMINLGRSVDQLLITEIPTNDRSEELDELTAFAEDIRQALERHALKKRPSDTNLTTYGQKLFKFCLSSGIERIYRTPSHIHIITNQSELKRIPWEYMQDPMRGPGPGRKHSIVRIVSCVGDSSTPLPLNSTRKIKVLFCAADPIDQDRVDWARVARKVEETLRPLTPFVDTRILACSSC